MVEPIVSKELLEEYQVQTKKNTRTYQRRNDYIFFQKILCPNCHRIMTCKSPCGKKKHYIYYKCNDCGCYVREDMLEDKLIEEISLIIEFDIVVRQYFVPLLKHKLENPNDLLRKEINSLKDKLIRLKDAYLNQIIDIEEYKADKEYLEKRLSETENKLKVENELEDFNFSFDDVMLSRDLESIKYILDPLYHSKFIRTWKKLDIKEKQNLIISYIDSIEVIKNKDEVKIKNINFRPTFIKEYAKLFCNGGFTRHVDVKSNRPTSEMEVSYPMTREEAEMYVDKLSKHCPIEYVEVKK